MEYNTKQLGELVQIAFDDQSCFDSRFGQESDAIRRYTVGWLTEKNGTYVKIAWLADELAGLSSGMTIPVSYIRAISPLVGTESCNMVAGNGTSLDLYNNTIHANGIIIDGNNFVERLPDYEFAFTKLRNVHRKLVKMSGLAEERVLIILDSSGPFLMGLRPSRKGRAKWRTDEEDIIQYNK